MIRAYSNGRFEWFVVATVIALVSVVALSRYWLIAEDTRIFRLEMTAHRFVTAAANVRVEFLTNNLINTHEGISKQMVIAGRVVFFSSQAWPVSVSGPVNEHYRVVEEDCAGLWDLLLLNPSLLSTTAHPDSDAEYQLKTDSFACRFELVNGKAFFDYYPLEGRMKFIKHPVSKGAIN